MKHCLFLFVTSCLIVGASCKKQNPKQDVDNSSADHGIHIPLTRQEALNFQEIIKKDGIKDSADFMAKVRTAQAQAS